jgi:hypothetical protein
MKRTILAVVLSAAIATPAVAGPPWISIETRPYGAAFLLARTFHHGTPMPLPLNGTAYGLVNGRRTSVALRFEQEGDANSFAVPKTWGTEGVWVLNIGVDSSDHGTAGAVVGIDRHGQSAFVRFPRTPTGFSRKATSGEVDAMLRALEAGQQPPALSSFGFNPFMARAVAALAALALVAVGAVRLLMAGVRRIRAPSAQAVAT